MAQTFETLSRQEATLKSIRGIVHTMKTLSAINAVPYEQAVRSIESYHQVILRGFAAFAYCSGEIGLRQDAAVEHLLVVFGSDHGLCGNYNEALAVVLKRECAARQDGIPRLLCVGAKMNDALLDHDLFAEAVLLPPASSEGIGRLAGDIVTRVAKMADGQLLSRTSVTLVYSERREPGQREPVTLQLLPLAPALLRAEKRWESRSLPDYSMASEALLAALVRSHIFACVSRAGAEAMAAENAARLALMQRAEEAVDERLETVTGELRSVRQTVITDELMDVIAGFESLKKNNRHGAKS